MLTPIVAVLVCVALAASLASCEPAIRVHGERQEEHGFVCQNLTLDIPLTQNVAKSYTQENYDIDFFYDVMDFKVFRTATYPVVATYCAPSDDAFDSAKDTVVLLSHGATFSRHIFDFPYQPERYSWVRKLWAAGYSTFAWDNIGCGESAHPDGLFEVQTQGVVEGNRHIAGLLRSGTIGHAFSKIAYNGFSIGAVAGVSLAAQYPAAVDAMVLHGYSWALRNLYPGYLAGLQGPAAQLENPAWRNLSSLYTSQSSPQARQVAVFYGDYDPGILPVDYALRDTDTLGLALTFGYHLVPAPAFTGPVFLGDGNQDNTFCGRTCGEQPYDAYTNFPRAADVDVHVYNQTGHGVYLHNSAPRLQSDTLAFLARNGL